MEDSSPAAEDAEELHWRTEYRETVYDCPGFSIMHEGVTLPDGTETDFDYLAEEPSVVVLPFTPAGEVLTIEEWRQAVKRVTLSFPAGGVEPDEELVGAAHRELEEETGYEADSVRALGTFEPATGFSNATFHYFVATGCRPTGERTLDADESIRVAPSTLPDLFDALEGGHLRDGRTALGLLAYAHERTDLSDVGPP